MSDNPHVLAAGATMREGLLGMYVRCGKPLGRQFAQRYVFEIGEVMADVHTREEAATMLYHIADAITCKLPVPEWREQIAQPEPAPQPVVAAQPEKRPWLKRVWGVIDRLTSGPFLIGFFAGLLLGNARR